METIRINVANKIATAVGTPLIVCGNSDYNISFTFDAEWNAYYEKTARFVFLKDGIEDKIDVVFSGTTCNVPILKDIEKVTIGVYAGELRTTTGAEVRCKKSVLCGFDLQEDPQTDVYNQLMEELSKSDGSLWQEILLNRERINSIASLGDGSTTGDAELQDIRIASNGGVYDTAGDMVRNEINYGINAHIPPSNELYGKTILYGFPKMPFEKGYIKTDGTIDTASFKHLIINGYGIKSIIIMPSGNASIVPFVYEMNGEGNPIPLIQGNITQPTTYTFNAPTNKSIGFNFFDAKLDNGSYKYPYYCTITYFTEKELKGYVTADEVEYNHYAHCVDKPFDFGGKSALFFGDSITKGYVNGTDITENCYPKLFCDKVGMTFTNKAIGGALYTEGKNDVGTLLYQLQSATLNSDFLFVAGGTNDYSMGVTLTEFKDAVTNTFEYIKNNYSGKVIVISPIYRAIIPPLAITQIEEYANILKELSIKYEFNLINGLKFHFPNETNNLSAELLPDGTHPSEKGYRLYARELATILC